MVVAVVFNCAKCEKPMIWGSDHDTEDADGVGYIVSNYHCNDCNSWIEHGQPVEEPNNG